MLRRFDSRMVEPFDPLSYLVRYEHSHRRLARHPLTHNVLSTKCDSKVLAQTFELRHLRRSARLESIDTDNRADANRVTEIGRQTERSELVSEGYDSRVLFVSSCGRGHKMPL